MGPASAALAFVLAAGVPVDLSHPRAQPRPPVGQADRGAPTERIRVMLLDLKASPAFAASARPLGQIVAEEAARVGGYELLSADEVRAALDQEANKQLLGCDENSCLAELAQALDAALVIGGSLDAGADGEPIVSLTLLNTRAIVVLNRVTMPWPGEPAALPEVVRAAARTLVHEPSARPPGAIRMPPLPSGARVWVDGVERTAEASAGQVAGLAIGPHEIKVQAPDKLPATAFVLVKSNETGPLELVLEDTPVPAVWLWLGGGGAILLGGAAAIGVAYALGQSDVVVSAAVPAISANSVEELGLKGRR
jgi:hypothetical protein